MKTEVKAYILNQYYWVEEYVRSVFIKDFYLDKNKKLWL